MSELPFIESNKTLWRDRYKLSQSLIDQMYAEWEEIYWEGIQRFDDLHSSFMKKQIIRSAERILL